MAYDTKAQQAVRHIAEAQAEALRQTLDVEQEQKEFKAAKVSAAKKITPVKVHSMQIASQETKVTTDVKKPLELLHNKQRIEALLEPKQVTQTVFVPEASMPVEVTEQIKSVYTLSSVSKQIEPETVSTEVSTGPQQHAEFAAEPDMPETTSFEPELFAPEFYETEQQLLMRDMLGDNELEGVEATEPNGLLAELPFLEFEQFDHPAESFGIEASQPPALNKQIAEYIETLEPARSEEATAILSLVLEKIEHMQIASIDGDEKVDTEAIQQELEILCNRLVVCLGLEPTTERVKYLLQTLIRESKEQVSEIVDETYDEGTHERKQDFTLLMSDWTTGTDHSLFTMVGKFVLHLTGPYSFAVA